MFFTVTQVCRSVQQPRGGFIKLTDFETISLDDQTMLYAAENLDPRLVGMAVDSLTRFSLGVKKDKAFASSIHGAYNLGNEAFMISADLGEKLKGLDDDSIINACRLVAFDEAFRNPRFGDIMPSIDLINPDFLTISNIRRLVDRSVRFLNQYGPVVETGFTFESAEQKKNGSRDCSSPEKFISGGYTYVVANGEGDYLTKDTIWDFKVSKLKPKPRDTLQILIYWIMGRHCDQDIYKGIDRIGIFNPRLNTAYLLETDKIPIGTIQSIERDIIGYESK